MEINKKVTLEELKAEDIPLPPKDSKCQICGRKCKSLSFVNGFWICIYMDCHNKAKSK